MNKSLLFYFLLLCLSLPIKIIAHDAPLHDVITICYNYGCKKTAKIKIEGAHWNTIKSIFTPIASTAAEERERIIQAIGLMEFISGQQSPTYRDKAKNPLEVEWPGQMDCIDESRNTTTYLHFLEEKGFLRWHKVLKRIKRHNFITPHWTGRIIANQTQQEYAIDSWYFDNGHPPFIQKAKDWKRGRPFKTPVINYKYRNAFR